MEWMSGMPKDVVLALVRYLIFSLRIAAVAEQLGVEVRILREPEKLQDQSGGLLLCHIRQFTAVSQ